MTGKFVLGTSRLATVVLASLLAMMLVSNNGHHLLAAGVTVNSVADAVDALPGDGRCASAAGECTLRAAVQEANLLPGADTIALPAGTYTLAIAGRGEDLSATGDLDILDDVTLTGVGATSTIIDGGGLDRVLHVVGVGVDLAIAGITVQNGAASASDELGGGILDSGGSVTLTDSIVRNNSAWLGGGIGNPFTGAITLLRTEVSGNSAQTLAGVLGGGGIGNAGTLTLTDSTVSGNSALGTGGGIGSFGSATLIRSSVSGNSAGNSGGGFASAGGTLTLIDSTVSGNSARGDAGAIAFVGSSIMLNNTTITGNVADSDANGSGDGGGIDSAVTVAVSNTIVAGNSDPGGEAPDCSGAINSLGYNLIQSTAGCTILGDATGNITGRDAMLGPLADNGGLTQTHALLDGSPAVDGANLNPLVNGCEVSDQRGVSRPQDGDDDGVAVCDIGAFESASDDVEQQAVAFHIRNTNTSGFACPSDGADYTVRGHITGRKSVLRRPGPHAVTLYLYGLDTGEWNWRFAAVRGYNWPVEMAKAGHISLTIDMLGYETSGHPHGFMSCFGSQADVTHQIIGELRSGTYETLDGRPSISFATIVLAGHDTGGAQAEIEAYSYKDIDGLIVTGWAEQGGTPFILSLFAQTLASECANGGENAEDGGPGGGYFTMALDNPETTDILFDDADPRVVEAAMAMRNKNPCGYFFTLLEFLAVDRARLPEIEVPVLLLYSNTDPVFAGTGGVGGGTEDQAGHFTGSSDVTTEYASTGHFPMLERGVDDYRGVVSDWLCTRALVSSSVNHCD